MNKEFEVIPVKDYYVVVETKRMEKNCYYFYHSVCLGNPMGEVAVIIASIGKRIEGIPFIEIPDEVEQEAKNRYCYTSENPPYTIITPKAKIEGYIEGYKAAQSKRIYTEEDIKKSYWVTYRLGSIGSGDSEEDDRESFEEWWRGDAKYVVPYLQSLQKKKLIKSVVLELYDNSCCWNNPINCICGFCNTWPVNGKEKGALIRSNPETNTITPKEVIYV